jgi:hypothetical protein
VTAVNSSPTGATIRVGNASCVTPNCRLKLPVGDNTLQASLPGYAPVSKIIHVDQRSGSPAVEFNLNALPSVVRVNTNFASGDVSLDGQPYGTLQSGQLVLNAVAEGEHKLQVTGPDGNAEVAFSASPAQQPKLSSPISANNISALVVSSLGNRVRLDCNCGPETKLAVDGRALGGVGAGGRELTELAQGSHELQLGEGDATRTHIVNVEAAPALNIFLDSERQVGTLVVQAGVENANVFIGGRKVGRTGADGVFRAPLPVQDVSVRVEKSGFEPVPPQTAQIRKNREMGLMFELRPAARKAPAYLSIMDASPDASVMVDGKAVGYVNDEGRFTSEVSEGQHTIELLKNGYPPMKWSKRFQTGDTLVVGGAMAKAKTPDATQPKMEQPPASTTTPNPPQKAPTASVSSDEQARQKEQEDWQRVKDSNDSRQLEAFLSVHSTGSFSDQARSRLRQLQSESERSAVLQTLGKYVNAYQHKSVSELQAVWPSLDKQERKKISDSFKDAKAIRMELKPVKDPSIEGDTATVTCSRSLEYSFSGGVQKPFADTITIRLRKRAGSWVIDGMTM